MRAVQIVLAAWLLAACAPAPRCDLSLTRNIAFSGEAAQDTITVRTFGPSCDKTVGVLEIRSEEGHPIWSWSAPLPHAFGEVFAADEPDEMQGFLERWAQPELATTQAAPEWSELAPDQTTLDQFTYDDIRARDLPMLCHASGAGRELCVFWEPAAGGAGHLYDRDIEENET